MVSGDVFRPPKDAMLLCVQLGSGVQIITSSFATLLFAALGERHTQEQHNLPFPSYCCPPRPPDSLTALDLCTSCNACCTWWRCSVSRR